MRFGFAPLYSRYDEFLNLAEYLAEILTNRS